MSKLPVLKPSNDAVECGKCYLGVTNQCCTNMKHYDIFMTEGEAEAFGFENTTFDEKRKLYKMKYVDQHGHKDACPHFTAEGRCGVHESRPTMCVVYPLYVTKEKIFLDLVCGGVGQHAVKLLTDMEKLKHVQWAMQMFALDPEDAEKIWANNAITRGEWPTQAFIPTNVVVKAMQKAGLEVPAYFCD